MDKEGKNNLLECLEWFSDNWVSIALGIGFMIYVVRCSLVMNV